MTFSHVHKSFMLSLFLILPFQVSTAYTDSNTLKPVEWLFVVTSKEGEIKQNQQGQYELTLNHAHIERILMFSDRPNRIVNMISPQDFKNMWGEGKNAFEKDPPNAIAVFDQEKIAMTLMSTTVDKDKTTFLIESDDDALRSHHLSNVSLFIDMKVRASIKKMNPNCKPIRDKARKLRVICILPKHKQRQG